MTRDLEYYRRQPYGRTFEVRTEGGERYLLYRIKEIPTIAGDGLTKDEALRNLREASDDYIISALSECLEIADPTRPVISERAPGGGSDLAQLDVSRRPASPVVGTAGLTTRRVTPVAA